MTVLWTNWGPHIWHDGRLLHVHDINPELKTQWRLTRGELFRMSWKLFLVALLGEEKP